MGTCQLFPAKISVTEQNAEGLEETQVSKQMKFWSWFHSRPRTSDWNPLQIKLHVYDKEEQRENIVRLKTLSQTKENTKHKHVEQRFKRTQKEPAPTTDLRVRDEQWRSLRYHLQERVSFPSQSTLVWEMMISFSSSKQEHSFDGICKTLEDFMNNHMSKHWSYFQRHEYNDVRRRACTPFVKVLIDAHSRIFLCHSANNNHSLEENYAAFSS